MTVLFSAENRASARPPVSQRAAPAPCVIRLTFLRAPGVYGCRHVPLWEMPMLADHSALELRERDTRRVASPKDMTDVGLLAQMAAGDTLAMQTFYARHNVRVFRFIVRIISDHSLAEDVISEVFLDVWRQAGRFEGRSAASTWLLAIARHKAYAVLRRRRSEFAKDEVSEDIEDAADTPEATHEKGARSALLRRRRSEFAKDEVSEDIEDAADTPEATHEKGARSALLRRCLEDLTPIHREIIDLVYYHEKSVAEVATICDIPENTVKTRLFYARKRLATLARAAGIDREWL
jgi:RNA polymerase sigma-70 factor (ECF subfamily)